MSSPQLSVARTISQPVPRACLLCRSTGTPEEQVQHEAIRRKVFVEEQAVFAGTDRDDHDRVTTTVHVLGYVDGVPAGTVRLFPLDPVSGLWQGDRLAVLQGFRTHGLGGPLVRFAVATAGAHAGSRMVAHVQLSNVSFFKRLGWTCTGKPEMYVGLPHQEMTIDLPSPEEGAAVARQLAVG